MSHTILNIIFSLFAVVIVLLSLTMIVIAAIDANVTHSVRKFFKSKTPEVHAKAAADAIPSIIKLRRKQDEILRKANARDRNERSKREAEILARQLEIAGKLTKQKQAMSDRAVLIKKIMVN